MARTKTEFDLMLLEDAATKQPRDFTRGCFVFADIDYFLLKSNPHWILQG